MSGHNVPYQLRTNKFVERQLFLDILDFVRVWNGPAGYTYASMGGRFLEDFRLINARFAIERMICIELDTTTWARQKFNRLGFIECRNQSSGEFVEDLDSLLKEDAERRFIVWLDFAIAKDRGSQLSEFSQLISKLGSGDVAKITLNANPTSFRRRSTPLTRKDFDVYLKDPSSETHKDYDTFMRSFLGPERGRERSFVLSQEEYDTICIKYLKEQLGDFVPPGGISSEDLASGAFAALLLRAVKVAALKGLDGTNLHVLPLAAFRYADGEHQMMTLTALIADDSLKARTQADKFFREWPFRAKDWTTVINVEVPDVSAKERHFLDGAITEQKDVESIHGIMPFQFDKLAEDSQSLLEAYLHHYRRYPSFMRVQ